MLMMMTMLGRWRLTKSEMKMMMSSWYEVDVEQRNCSVLGRRLRVSQCLTGHSEEISNIKGQGDIWMIFRTYRGVNKDPFLFISVSRSCMSSLNSQIQLYFLYKSDFLPYLFHVFFLLLQSRRSIACLLPWLKEEYNDDESDDNDKDWWWRWFLVQ